MPAEKYLSSTLIIPTFNEAKNISKIIRIVNKKYPGMSIIISDDGSNDGTQEIVKNFRKTNGRIRLLDRSNENVHGLTASVVHGMKITKTKYVVVIDGDLQHPPEKIGKIVKKLLDGADIVVGTREKDLTSWVWHRRLISKSAILLGRARLLMNGINCRDMLSGFFGIKTNLVKSVIKNGEDKFQLEGYKILFDVLKQVPNDTKIDEVPYLFGLRKTGQSKLNKKHVFLYLKSLFK